jgi:hypothetical protein
LKKKRFQGPHRLPWQELDDKDHRKILYGHIPIHDLTPSASLHAGLYYLPALTQPPFKSGASAFTSNHQTPYYTAPLPSTLPREAISPSDFPCLTLIPFPSPLQIAMPIKWPGLDPLELAQKHMQSVCESVSATRGHHALPPYIYTPHHSSDQPRTSISPSRLLAC